MEGMRKIEKFIVDENSNGIRIDAFVSKVNERISRTLAQTLIKDEKILLDGKKVKASIKVLTGQLVEVCEDIQESFDLKPTAEEIPIDVIYEDEDIIVVNKPKNMVVHPAAGNKTGTLVNAVLGKAELSDVGGEIRPRYNS
jgi:23S rRNA pseudouridine1911/1915/1917 synthase